VLIEKVPFFAYVIVVGAAELYIECGQSCSGQHSAVLDDGYGLLIFIFGNFCGRSISIHIISYPSHHDHQWSLFGICVHVFIDHMAVVRSQRPSVDFAVGYYALSVFFLLRFEGEGSALVSDRTMYLPSLGLCLLLGRTTESFL